MTEMAHWSFDVSTSTDADVRAFLAERGGDLGRFVEQAVNRVLFDESLEEIGKRNAHLDPVELEQLIDSEVREMRKEFWATPRY